MQGMYCSGEWMWFDTGWLRGCWVWNGETPAVLHGKCPSWSPSHWEGERGAGGVDQCSHINTHSCLPPPWKHWPRSRRTRSPRAVRKQKGTSAVETSWNKPMALNTLFPRAPFNWIILTMLRKWFGYKGAIHVMSGNIWAKTKTHYILCCILMFSIIHVGVN